MENLEKKSRKKQYKRMKAIERIVINRINKEDDTFQKLTNEFESNGRNKYYMSEGTENDEINTDLKDLN